jgi:hypothetical protein
MATQRFLSRVSGKTRQVKPVVVSAGVADAGKLLATGSDGKIDPTVLPPGIGADITIAPSSDELSAGNFVNFYADAGTLKCRLADNSNGRQADGYVNEAVEADADATVYPLDSTNANLSGLTPGADYWLGTAGGVTNTPLDGTDDANSGKIDQYLGKAKSATELITTDDSYVIL